jgi:uncharacterized protein
MSAARTIEAANTEGRVADNILFFGRVLRKAGMKVGPASVRDAIDAVITTGIGSREDFYWTLHAVFVKRHEDHPVFDDAFRLYWKSRELIEKLISMFSPVAMDQREKKKQKAGETRVSQALFEGHHKNQRETQFDEVEVDARFSVSGKEILREKDFGQMTAAEISEAKREIARLSPSFEWVKTRRFTAVNAGAQLDPRRMMREAMRSGGELILPKFREPKLVHPPLVVLADISGSMSQYSRIFLHFLHVLTEERRKVQTFVFGTRLTNITRQMRYRDPDEALALCSVAVKDWSGGTRIGDTLAEFNRKWSRRVLGQGAEVLLITDGLERDDVANLSVEMERLSKSCRRLIWLNPLLRFDGFEAKARGVRAMLPFVDEFRAVHNLNALADVCAALSGKGGRMSDPKLWLANAREAA